MREGWTLTPLASVTRQVIEPIDLRPDVEYKNLGVKWYAAGTFLREPKPGRDIKASRLYRVRPGQFVYNRLFATEGSFALVRAEDAEAVASNEFPVFDVDTSRLLPEYLYLHFQQEAVWQEVNRQCTGTTKSRLRWKEERFRAYALPLPPLAEQRRIVDLIGALDDVTEATKAAAGASLAARDRFLDSKFGGAERVPVGSLLAGIEGGRSPKALDAPPALDEFGVLKVSAVTSLGFEPRESKTVIDTSVFSEHHFVRAGDVLLTRANTAALLGQVCLVPEDHSNLLLCDKTLRLKPAEGVSPAALVAALNSPTARAQLSAAATGTSASMKNISQDNVREVLVCWPKDAVTAGLADQALLAGHRRAQATMAQLLELRSAVLSALLSGEHEIPESYDELMEVAS
jgi:type I restriction enzyme S subunit